MRGRHRLPAAAATAVVLLVIAAVGWRWLSVQVRSTAGPAAGSAAPADTPARMQMLRLPSPGSGRPREVWVYRPPGVPDSPDLPVLYMLHGQPGSPADVFGPLDLDGSMDRFIRARGRPFVVVAPDGEGDTHADTEWADSVDGADRIETFLDAVVIPAVEGTHRRDAAHRAIAGLSMGGYGAMNLALRHRDLFGQVASLAGYFDVDDPDEVFGGRPAVIAANSPDQHAAAARGLRILLSDGSADAEPVARGQTQRFAALLRAAGVPATVRIVPGEHHDTAYVRGEFPALEAFLAAGWPP